MCELGLSKPFNTTIRIFGSIFTEYSVIRRIRAGFGRGHTIKYFQKNINKTAN